MGRELKRVPLDFDYPLGKIWIGYLVQPSYCLHDGDSGCELCRKFAQIKRIPFDGNCPDFGSYYKPEKTFDPPTGKGYQLWNTTTEGHPMSPVFNNLRDLSKWCENNATTFGKYRATAQEWYNMLNEDLVCHTEGNMIFI